MRTPKQWVSNVPFVPALLAGAAMVSSPAVACMCADRADPVESLGSYEVVFIGRVARMDSVIWEELRVLATGVVSSLKARFLGADPDAVRTSDYSIEVTFAVAQPVAGPDGQELTMVMSNTSCDYPFKSGREYLVYAYQAADGSFRTGKCSRTAPLASAEADVEILVAHFATTGPDG